MDDQARNQADKFGFIPDDYETVPPSFADHAIFTLPLTS
jgi:hypothetical protein